MKDEKIGDRIADI
jgi:hypothetical protein